MINATRRADSQKIRNQALHADTASPEPLITHPQLHRLNSYVPSYMTVLIEIAFPFGILSKLTII